MNYLQQKCVRFFFLISILIGSVGIVWAEDLYCQLKYSSGQGYSSDHGSLGPTFRYDDIHNISGDICEISWWGNELAFGNPMTNCSGSVTDFDIIFYADNNGVPGTEVASFTVRPSRILISPDSQGFDIWYYVATLSPCLTLGDGWVSIVGHGSFSCSFFWYDSPTGNNISYSSNGSTFTMSSVNLAFCLEGVALASITGEVWNDLDGDGINDGGEVALANWTVYIDENGNGQFDTGEPNDITDGSGNYGLLNLSAGDYTVGVEVQGGWEQTCPVGGGSYEVTVLDAQAVSNVDFGVAAGGGALIAGVKWHDINGNLYRDSGEPGLGGWLIYADVNENGVFDGNEPNTLTDANGAYSVEGFWAGTYLIGEQVQDEWEQVYPGGDGFRAVSVGVYGAVENIDFGNISDWRLREKLNDSNVVEHGHFGRSASISGDYAIVGAYEDTANDTGAGAAYVYKRVGKDWGKLKKIFASDGDSWDRFGGSVCISGDLAIAGANWDEENGIKSGSAYIFGKNHGGADNWGQIIKLLASDGVADDWFGCSVAIDGDWAVVGASYENGYRGSAYVYHFNGSSWVEYDKLVGDDYSGSEYFGHSVGIDGNKIIVGAMGELNRGAVYVFEFNGSIWSREQRITEPAAAYSGQFGHSVCIRGEYAIVGCVADDAVGSFSGSAYVYRFNGSVWSRKNKLVPSELAAGDRLGGAVCIEGTKAAVGARTDETRGVSLGSAYIYEADDADWSVVKSVKVTAGAGNETDGFGKSIGISGDTVIIAADGDDEIGVNKGASYIFSKGKCPKADLDEDCFVNMLDFRIMALEWLQ